MADIDGPSRPSPTFQRALISGAISGLSVDFMFFPLDTVKTRIQSSAGFWHSGGFKGVYRGVGSVGLGSAPGASAFFVTYETLKKQLPKYQVFANNSSLAHMAAASGAEYVSCLIRVPTEVVKSRTQTGAYGHGMSSLHSAISTMKHEGIRGFYRGFGITLTREIPFTSIQFPLYEYFKSYLSRNYLGGKRPTSYEAALCGSVAGGIAAAATTPLDVVKTRVMLEARISASASGAEVVGSVLPPEQPSPSVLSFPPRLLNILRTEGPATLFRGWVPRTFAISMGGAVFLGIYDLASNFGIKEEKEDQVA
ncbi:solute carrier family 25 (mitochondrial S-adenosylmethionine transporter), member 26 [Cryptococcus gattii E566]|uniref:S-adenosylmethionine transporter, putative n=2 Tax=Cryptococcus gattii TaxID=37769 RepID=E6R9A0_CRYGW|nr:S-adenosylmethionine transporter, putative [Cryptococcus gattii WM276]ADV23383.1 S-adenosylmethionine transporter, putative [Cryptococcus gattii WM276]KIR77789.1 solute carrier family 25 (mitochondrial S-adenosylmethionine transporter), member 26 [Cryptococcus gattii EJB2]KIY35791.1 solute carrier family 25 (mitochondrial S-adenosylmethionine transporter), member 26 [Cryptococcus gattii E566]KJE01463.1 solute carrier family 25 (mitochondrial S-adenosylmethionine transporter), member 26 [Cryp